ncbi:hypothetical protein E2320_005327 [Naja naja]|nr:hypothetical protein E2320_005327 [Naja naja]
MLQLKPLSLALILLLAHMMTVSPEAAEYLFNAVQTPVILEIRNFLIKETAKLSVMAEQVGDKLSGLWKELKESTQ